MTTKVKEIIDRKVEQVNEPVKLTKSMSIPDMVRAMEPEIKKALPSVLTPERFLRMAMSALNNTPQLRECSPISFIAALLTAAQLGLEPNTPLGQAYLIPYKNKGITECQFQLGYKGLITLAFRTGQMQMVQAHVVRERDVFDFEYGMNPKLIHRPADGSPEDRGEITYIYAMYKLLNGGYNFEVANKAEIDYFAAKYSKAFVSQYSPWSTAYEEMAKKTVIKRALKYAPISAEFQRALSTDESIKTELSVDMSEIRNECMIDMEETDGEGEKTE